MRGRTMALRVVGSMRASTATIVAAIGADWPANTSTLSPSRNVREDLHPRRGQDIEDTDLPTRFGPALGGGNTPASDLPTSTGFEIGTDQGPTGPSTNAARVGPSIGDSSLNPR